MSAATFPGRRGWIGVDLDGTLARYDGWRGVEHVGAPIPATVERVLPLLAEGWDVRVFTARVSGDDAEQARAPIEAWCARHLWMILSVTHTKD